MSLRRFAAAALLTLMVRRGHIHSARGGTPTVARKKLSTEERLRRLEDLEAFARLLVAYGRNFDKRDFAAYGNLFAKEGTWTGGAGEHLVLQGPGGDHAPLSRRSIRRPCSRARITSCRASTSSSMARTARAAWSRWTFVVTRRAQRARAATRGGWYEDTFIREDGANGSSRAVACSPIRPRKRSQQSREHAMGEMTRRQFVGVAGGMRWPLPKRRPARRAVRHRRPSKRAKDLTEDELQAMFDRCSNTGKWGPNDELGTLNYITAQKRIAAAGLVKTGEVVLGRARSRHQGDQDQSASARPAHVLDAAGQYCADGLFLDRLARNDRDAHGCVGAFLRRRQALQWARCEQHLHRQPVRSGAPFMRRRTASSRVACCWMRPRLAASQWYEKDEYVTVADFEAAEARQKLKVQPGDAIFVRTGFEIHEARRASRTSTRAPASTRSAWSGCTSGRYRSTAATVSKNYPIRASASPRAMHMIGLVSDGPADPGLAVPDAARPDLRTEASAGTTC